MTGRGAGGGVDAGADVAGLIQALAGVSPRAGADIDPVAAGASGVPCGMIAGVGRRAGGGTGAAGALRRAGVTAGRSGAVRAGVVRPGQVR